jgi:hypothetical protein
MNQVEGVGGQRHRSGAGLDQTHPVQGPFGEHPAGGGQHGRFTVYPDHGSGVAHALGEQIQNAQRATPDVEHIPPRRHRELIKQHLGGKPPAPGPFEQPGDFFIASPEQILSRWPGFGGHVHRH